MSERAALADFSLVRSPALRSILPLGRLVLFTAPIIGDTTPEDWTHERVTHTALPYTFLTYSTCLSKGCLIVFKAFLTQDDPMSIVEGLEPEEIGPPVRLTEMRLWQMIVDCWLAAGGTADSLRWVAFHHIVNDDVVKAMNEERTRQGAQEGEQTLVMTSGGAGWNDNAFARCSSNVATALRDLDAEKKSIQVKAHLMFPEPGWGGLHMIAELSRDGKCRAAPVQEKAAKGPSDGQSGSSGFTRITRSMARTGGKPVTGKPMGKPMGKPSGGGVTKRPRAKPSSSHIARIKGEQVSININIRFI
ncbi:hypothetical protein N0V82_005875 [Gnomoniopsis sp. IMI 355080]|nr:hypothetical protein N0V82_005875 [Gnomoniopsis sp. IMI 355080]